MNHLPPQAPENALGSFQIFSKKIHTEILASQGALLVSMTLVAIGKFATGVNNTGSKFSYRTAGVVDTSGKFAARVNDKFTTPRCPNKIIKTFLIEDFFLLPLVSMTPVVHLEL